MKAVNVLAEATPRLNNPDCKRCKLCKTSGSVCVDSSGPKRADIMLIGEALGAMEEAYGENFVGDAGKKLDYELDKVQLDRSKIKIANCARCRPPGNGKPSMTVLRACADYLIYDIFATRPKVIVALGGTAANVLFQRNVELKEWRGFPREVMFQTTLPKSKKVLTHKCWVLASYHPAACLRDWTKDALLEFDLLTAKQLAKGTNRLHWPTTDVKIVKTLPEAIDLFKRLKRAGAFVVDIEGTKLNPHVSKTLCIGFCYKAGEAWVLPIRKQGAKKFWSPKDEKAIMAGLKDALTTCKLYGQNLKFDTQHLRKMTGVEAFKIGYDTMQAQHCIDENIPANLTFMCQWYLGWDKYDELTEQYKGKEGKKKIFNTDQMPDHVLWTYNGYDVDGTFQVRQKQLALLKKEGVQTAFDIELGLITPIADMEFNGIRIDRARQQKLREVYRIREAEYLKRLTKIAIKYLGEEKGNEFNANSTAQLLPLLLAAGAKLKKKTKSKTKLSCDKFVLAALSLRNNPAGRLAKAVIDLRKTRKYLSTYLGGESGNDGMFSISIQGGNTLYPTYNLATVTGRLSADYVQTLPRAGGVRTVVIPDNPDDVLLCVDYSKLELCILAWAANDEVMIREIKQGIDLHKRMACAVELGRDPTDEEFAEMAPNVSKDRRAVAKGVIFGANYGRGAKAIADANPDVFPINMLNDERYEIVQAMLNAYFDKYQGITHYMLIEVEKAQEKGHLRTQFYFRKRRFERAYEWFNSSFGQDTSMHEIDKGHVEREILNFRIQSIATDTLSKATAKVFYNAKKENIPHFRIVTTQHDALVINVRRDWAERTAKLVSRWMETKLPKNKFHPHEMILKVDPLIQQFWGEEYVKEEKAEDLKAVFAEAA